jgi:hypothetical protein
VCYEEHLRRNDDAESSILLPIQNIIPLFGFCSRRPLPSHPVLFSSVNHRFRVTSCKLLLYLRSTSAIIHLSIRI